ncbi:MAG: hypothetical protein NKF70_09250 [Methanobacterium sp. ERen5]|nr:MAG: hypothetical protein NKF70_09250 [Methanobacterium sp. ERen5]
MIEEIEQRIVDNFHRDLLKSRGEKLVKCQRVLPKLDEDNTDIVEKIVLSFEDTDQIDIENTYNVCIKATNMDFKACDNFNNPVDIHEIIGRRLLDYGEIYFDTFNNETSGSLRTKLIFEDDYEIKVDGNNLQIEAYIEDSV